MPSSSEIVFNIMELRLLILRKRRDIMFRCRIASFEKEYQVVPKIVRMSIKGTVNDASVRLRVNNFVMYVFRFQELFVGNGTTSLWWSVDHYTLHKIKRRVFLLHH